MPLPEPSANGASFRVQDPLFVLEAHCRKALEHHPNPTRSIEAARLREATQLLLTRLETTRSPGEKSA
ncbi:MAG: hypothetical protein HQL99_05175 [Magnetococcales bacterium]|nr:hypothetical protein [Magnetococcales bacterium]